MCTSPGGFLKSSSPGAGTTASPREKAEKAPSIRPTKSRPLRRSSIWGRSRKVIEDAAIMAVEILAVQERENLVSIEIGAAKNDDVLVPFAVLGNLEKTGQGESRRSLNNLVLLESQIPKSADDLGLGA